MKVAAVLVSVFAASFFTAGCSNVFGRQRADEHLTVTQNLVIADVPVPSGYRIDMSRTYYSSSGGTRVGHLVYTGQSDFPTLLEFFRENMPISGWTLVKESSISGSYLLHFEKPSESAVVTVTPGRFQTDLSVDLSPKGGRSVK